MSSFVCVIISLVTASACGPASSSFSRSGITCQDRPKRSRHQPHCDSAPPSAISADHRRSTYSCESTVSMIETASDSVKYGPPLSSV